MNANQANQLLMNQLHKLVVCDVRDGSLISQHEPNIPGVEWFTIPSSIEEAGRYYQVLRVAKVPLALTADLPEHCWVDDRYWNVRTVRLVGEEVKISFQGAINESVAEEAFD